MRSCIPKDVPEESVPKHPCDSISVASTTDSGTSRTVKEMDYCTMLNRSLPEGIRVLGWTPVTDAFSARFSAAFRTYRYFFLRRNLDIASMKLAAASLVGVHDFSNFCKMDLANVSNFKREIYAARIVRFRSDRAMPDTPMRGEESEGVGDDGEDDGDERGVWMLELRGIAFLWHMVRCIMAVLFMVGGKDCAGASYCTRVTLFYP